MQTWLHVLDWRATCDADVTAVRDEHGSLSYRAFAELIERRAGGWHAQGLEAGDVVAVLVHNSIEFLVETLALARLGAIPLLLNWRMTPFEVGRILDVADPRGVVVDESCQHLVAESGAQIRILNGAPTPGWIGIEALDAPAPPRPVDRLHGDQIGFLMHTSGTTGVPKLIPLDHGSLIRSLAGFALDIGDQVRGSRHLVMMPMFHLAGFAQAMQCFLTGGTLFIRDGFDAAGVIDTVERHRINFFTAAPTIIEMLVAELEGPRCGADVSSLVEVQYGASPISPDLLARALEVVCSRFRQIYGSTELQGFVSILRPEHHLLGGELLGSAGQVSLGWEARVVDADGVPLPSDSPGELHVRGDCLIDGYWQNPEETVAAWTADGWYRTGDLATLRDDGFLTIVGRAKEMIISGGENVYPAEIELVLARHPDVLEAAVIGVPDSTWGEVPAAFVVTTGQATEAELIAHCRAHLAGFKSPRSVEQVAELPRNALGKIVKADLRKLTGPLQH